MPTRVDLWLNFTGMAYGLESILVEASPSSIVLQLDSGSENSTHDNSEFGFLQEVVASPQFLKTLEIRVFTESRSSVSSQSYLTLVSSRLPCVRRHPQTQAVEIVLSEIFGISATEQSNWTRHLDRTFLKSRV